MIKQFKIIDLLLLYIVAYLLIDQPLYEKKIVFFIASIIIFILEKLILSSRELNRYFKPTREGFISDVLIGVLFFWYIFNVLNIATILILLVICILKFKEDFDLLLRK
ncbi:hypothetical protein BAMA_11700 [Bacillus manliponensis]|uniref:Uncharacterized protein n=1 Tax=Bacillus manliponensis TaxID=574376 RepID=A0A073JTQ8_9BACI|nr:hypothetical protein BAMA_11700 [Bacillus manliponensis]